MELESHPSYESKPTHISDTTAKVTDILSDRLGVLTTVTSKERILFDIEELYLADDKCDSSRPLSVYVIAGKTELQCDASFLPGNNEWNIRYKATCVWKHRKPPFIKIFSRHISNCSASVSLVPGCIYEGHIVQVSPPHAALAIVAVHNISFAVLIFLNRLFKDSSLKELQNCEWIQDQLNTGDKVEFKFEKTERKSVHKKFHVPAFAWKSESEGQREHTNEQKIQHDSGIHELKLHRCDNQGDNTVSNVATLEVTNSKVACVGSCNPTSGGTSLTEPPDKRNVDETKSVSTVEAAEAASNMPLLLYTETKLTECGIYTARETGSTNLSLLKSQEGDTKAAAAFSQQRTTQEATHTKYDEPTADLLDIPVQGETHDVPAVEHGMCGLGALSQQDGTQSVHGIPEGEYGAVSLYRILQSVQSEAEESLHLSGTGIVRNNCKVQTVHPQFLYELLKPPDERELQFRATLIGFVIFSFSRLPKYKKSHLPADDVFSNAGIRILPESSDEQHRTSKSSAALGIELEIPLDPLKPHHIAVPRRMSSSHSGMTAYVTGISLPEHESCDVLTSSSNDCLQIPVCLDKLPPRNSSSEYEAVTLQGKFPLNSSTVALDSTETVCDRQSCALDSCIQDALSQEMESDPSCEIQSKLSGHIEVPMQSERRSSKSVCDTPLILVPVFIPLSLRSSSEHMSMLPSTRWTLTSGAVADEKHCLMYIPSSALSCSAVSDKECTQSPDQPSEHNVTSPEELSASKPHSSHFGKYSGNIYNLGYDHGTVAFTVDGKMEKAKFYRKKVYVNGSRIGSQSKLHDVISLEMPVTLDAKRYEGESFTYKATAVYIQLNDEEQLEVCEVASTQNAASDVVSVNSDSTRLSHTSLQNNSTVCMDQTATNVETYLALSCWDNFCAENFGVRKQMKDSVSRTCACETNLTYTESYKDSAAGMVTSPGKDTDVTESMSTARQETAVNAHLSKETSNIASIGVLKSEEKTAVQTDDQEKVTVSKFETEFKPPGILKPSQIIDKMTESHNDPGELFTCKTNASDVASSVDFLPQATTQVTDKITVSDNDPGELFTCKTNASDVASSVDFRPQAATQVTDKITDSDNDSGELFTCKRNTSDVASSVDFLPQAAAQVTAKITDSDNDSGELFTCKRNASDVASSVDFLPQAATQATGKITDSDNDSGELFTCKRNASDVASSVDFLPQAATQVTDKIMDSDNESGELFTCKRNASDVASSVDFLPQAATQVTDKITDSDNDSGELFTCKINTSDVASSVDFLPQAATQATDKITVSDNDPGELFTNVAGVIDDVWLSNAVLMTATVKGVKLKILIYGRNLYINRKQCTVTNTRWQHLAQGMQVCANVSKLRSHHPSGAVYLATSAWKGKKPRSGNPCNIRPCGTETCVNCLKKVFSSDIDPSTSGSKVKIDAGRQKSKHCKTDGIKCPTVNTGTCREKPVLNEKSHSIQRKVDASVEDKKQKYHKALKSTKSLVGKTFVGTVERFTMDDGLGLVRFHLENEKLKAVFFREHIFSKGISVTDSYVKEKITAGRLVIVSAVKPYSREDIPYAVNIDTNVQDKKGDPATWSYSLAATYTNEWEEVTPTVQDLEFESCTFRVKEREMFYKNSLCYDWDKGSVTDSDECRDIEGTNHPEETCTNEWEEVTPTVQDLEFESCTFRVKEREMFYKNRLCYDWDKGSVTDSDECRDIEGTNHPEEVKVEKALCLGETVNGADEIASLDNKDAEVTDHSDEAKTDKPLCQEETDKITISDNDPGELFACKTNTSDVASSVSFLSQAATQVTDKILVSDNDPGELFACKTNTSDVASSVSFLSQAATQVTDKVMVSDNDPGELFACKTNTSDVASSVSFLPQAATQVTDKITVSDNDPGELVTCTTNTSDVASSVSFLSQAATQVTDKVMVSDNDPGELFACKTNTSDVASSVSFLSQAATQVTDKVMVSDNDPGELFACKTNTSDVACSVSFLSQAATQVTDKVMVSDNDPGELFACKTNTSDVASSESFLPQAATQVTDKITVSDNDPGELVTCKTNTSDVASSVSFLSQAATQVTDKVMVSDNDPGELVTCKTNTSDVASSVSFLPQAATQVTDKITVSDNDPGELFACKTNTSDVASSVSFLSQAATQVTDKVMVSDNDPGELFACKTNTSDVASSVSFLPQAATQVTDKITVSDNDAGELFTHVAGVIDDVWLSNAVLMTATVRGVKLKILIFGRNLYINGEQCTVTNTRWQHLVQGMQVFANVSKLRGRHPSGAVYLATSAWKGKKPRSGNPCNIRPCGTETCVNCLKKAFSSDIDLSTSGSKVKIGAGRQKSKHCKTDGIKCPTVNTGTCREKPVLNEKSHSIQRKVDASVEDKKQKYQKALKSTKSLVGKTFVGTVERFTMDDGLGLVSFDLQNEKLKAVFFREHIFSKGISVTDSYVKENITAGRLVIVSAVKPYYREDIPYAVNIDTDVQGKKGDPATWSYSLAATCTNEWEEVTPTVQDLEFESCKFRIKEREMFYKNRLCYDWDKGSVTDSDKCKDIEGTNHPEEVKVEKPLCLDETVDGADEIASLDNKDTEVTDHSDEAKTDKPSCQEETTGNAVATASSGNKQLMHLPVTSTQHTGLAKQLKEKLAKVKRYESSTRGILECSISGAVLEFVFDINVMKVCGNNEIIDMREHLPVDSKVYFVGEVVGEDSLLGCSDIVVTSVWESKTHQKPTNSKLTHSLTLELIFPSLHEGLVAGRIYEGIITKIHLPRAFVATVTEAGKTYDVFVLNTFFSPAEYGTNLPAKHSLQPYVAEGYKVHLMVKRQQEVNKKHKHTYEWFAVDAWTEEGDNTFTGSTPKTWFTSKELHDHQEGAMDADHHDHQKGVIMTLYPEWGVLNVDHLKEEVTFFAQDTFLYGVQLRNVDLRKVFNPGDTLCFIMSEEPALKKAYRAWLGSHDTSSDMHDIDYRTMEVFRHCNSRKIEKSVLVTLIKELGKQRLQLEVSGRIQTPSPQEEDDEDMWLNCDSRSTSPVRHGAILPDNKEHTSYEKVYCSDSWSDSDTSSVYVSDEVDESHEISCKESSVDQLKSSETGMPCSSSIVKTVEDTPVHNTSDLMSSVSNLERAEDLSQNKLLKEGNANQESHDTLSIIIETTVNNGCIVPVTRTSNQQYMLHTQNRSLEESRTHADEATNLSTDQCKRNVACCRTNSHLAVLHPEMHKTLKLLLCKAFEKYNVKCDVSQPIVSEAVTAVEEELKGVLMGTLLDRAFSRVTELASDSEKDKGASPLIFQTLTEISKEWRQKLSEFLSVDSVVTERSREQESVEDRTQLCSSHTQAVHVQVGGRVDKAVQTVSTGSVLFLKLLPDS